MSDGRSGGWIARYGLLYLGVNVAWAAPSQLLIANQVAGWHPTSKESLFAWVMGLGGLASIIVTPLAGAWSDRSRSPWGRRTPLIVVGAAAAAALLVVAGLTTAYWQLLVVWVAFQIAIALPVVAAQAIAPDQVPRRQYGVVSGVLGVTYTLAVVVGTLVAEALPVAVAYAVSAGVLVVLVGQWLLVGREPLESVRDDAGATATEPPRAGFWLVWTSRLLVTLGNTVALFYLLYFLRDQIRHPDPDFGVLVLTAVYAACVLAAATIAGIASDRLGHRVPFVAGAGGGIAAASFLMAFAGSFPTVVAAAALLGVSWGAFMAVDQALINEVLVPEARGRGMGIMQVAVVLPNAAAPLVAYLALTGFGGYRGLYLFAGVLVLGGATVVAGVRARPRRTAAGRPAART